MKQQEKGPSEKKKKLRRRARTATVAAVASAGVVVGGLFTSPDELLNGRDNADTPDGITETDGTEDEDPEDSDEEKGRRRGARAAAKDWIWNLPFWARTVIGVPLWALGWVIITGVSALWAAVLSPVFSIVARWICIAAVLLGVFLLIAKLMFPDLPVKKILNKRNFLTILIGVAVLGLADGILPVVWAEYARYANILRLSGATLLLAAAALLFARHEIKRRRRQPPPEEDKELVQKQVLQQVLQAVDATK